MDRRPRGRKGRGLVRPRPLRGSFGILLFTMQVRRSRNRSRIDICDCGLAGEQSGHRDASRREHDEF